MASPFDEGWRQGLAETSTWIHVKDKRLGEEGYVTAGAGDGQFPELLADVKARRDWSGVVAVEPHLAKGVSGPKLFGEAVSAIKSLLDQAKLAYR